MHCHPQGWEGVLIPSAVLAASLAGSGHCVLMCGGLVSAAARSGGGQLMYHVGRLAGYVALGAVSGWLGGRTVARLPEWGSTAVAWAVGLSFVWIGVAGWRKGSWHFAVPGSAAAGRWITRLTSGRASGHGPAASPDPIAAYCAEVFYAGAVGLLSIFLPCGWLYGFVLASLSTMDPIEGALLMTAFWAGTLPALVVSRWLVRGLARLTGAFAPKLSAILLIAAGVLPILSRYFTVRS